MSRHTLEPRDNSNYDIAVGWDGPTGSFYAQVITPDDRAVVDLGHAHDRIFVPGRVLDAVRDYAAIPVDLDNQLMHDALDDTSPTPHPDWIAYLAHGEIYAGDQD